jgi:transcriptional regulator with XRE-family HTH domain
LVAAIHTQGRVALLQLAPIRFKALKPKEPDFPAHTLGAHVRKRRLELELTQKQAAERLGVNPWTVLNWETGRRAPPIRSMPAILSFLGYDPFPEPTTIAAKLLSKRRQQGWSIREAALHLGIDGTTWRDWEAGELILFREHRTKVAEFLGLDRQELFHEMRARWNGKHRRWEVRRP